MKSDKPTIDVVECDGDGLIELSVSKSKTWRQCQYKYFYKYIMKLRPTSKNRPLTLGSLVHKCLEARALGINWVQEIKDFKRGDWSKLFEEEREMLGDIPGDAYRIMRGYHYFYLESDKRYKVIGAEIPFRVRIPKTNVVLVGIIDLLVLDTIQNQIWIFEHKTVKKDMPSEDFRMTDFQTAIYMYAVQKLLPQLDHEQYPVGGIILDYLKTKAPTIPEVLKNGTLSKRKITCDYYTYLDCVKKVGGDPADYADILEYMKGNVFYRRIPIVKSKHLMGMSLSDMLKVAHQIQELSSTYPTRNLTWTCDRPRCEYRDLCIAEMQGFDIDELIKLNFEITKEEEEKDGKSEDDNE